MQRACIVDVGDLFGFAKTNYGIEWNTSCKLFNDYYVHDSYTHLEPMCSPDVGMGETEYADLSNAEKASRIVEEFIATLDVPEGYDLMLGG